MRRSFVIVSTVIALLVPTTVRADEPPAVAQKPSPRHSEAMMVTGMVFTGFGVLSVGAGVATTWVGITTDMCKWGEESDCNSTQDARLVSIGVFGGLLGAGLGLGFGIPLWAKGARRDADAAKAAGTTVVVGSSGVRVRAAF
jgi:hypothetical protein